MAEAHANTRGDDESNNLITYKQQRKKEIDSDNSIDSPWAAVDFVFWQSAIFSRQAMALNHTSAHRYGDRKALGVFRIIAAVLTLSLFVFLTIYDLMVTSYRPWLMMNWWVCLVTFLFFAFSLVPAGNYFSE